MTICHLNQPGRREIMWEAVLPVNDPGKIIFIVKRLNINANKKFADLLIGFVDTISTYKSIKSRYDKFPRNCS